MRHRALTRLGALILLAIATSAARLEAQYVDFTSVPPNGFAGASSTVTIEYGGAYGQDAWCDDYGCYYYPYDNGIYFGTLQVKVNGAARTSNFTTSESETCTYGRYESDPWRCEQIGTASGLANYAPGTNALWAQVDTRAGGHVTANYSFQTATASVVVTPNPASITVAGGMVGRSADFVVQNTGTLDTRLLLRAQCSGTGLDANSCVSTSREIYLRAGESGAARVGFTTLASGGSGTATLIVADATNQDLGSASVGVTVNAASLAVVTVRTFQTGPNVERSLCPTFAVVPDVATQCGATRIAHPLPSVRSFGKTYTPTLAYYSDNVRAPYLLVDVALPATTTIPDEVLVYAFDVSPSGTLGGIYTSKRYPGSAWAATRTQRLNLRDLDGPSYMLNKYEVQVYLRYGADWVGAGQGVRGEIIPVVRRNGVAGRSDWSIGNGWGLLGLEELVTGQYGDVVTWIGGDGSTRKYVPVGTTSGTTVFTAASIMRPDTLYRLTDGSYRRALPHGVSVYFSPTGLHTRTVDRFGRETSFQYDGVGKGRLRYVTVPGGLTYEFAYSASELTITAPGSRVVHVNRIPNTLAVSDIVDPDGTTARFNYASWGSDWAIVGYTDRRGTYTDLWLEAYGRTLGAARTIIASQGAPINPVFVTAQGRGTSAAPTGESYDPTLPDYEYDGPRTDVADVASIWTDSLGAITRMVDATGKNTYLEHGDPRFPGLVTKVTNGANGFETRASYDARGRLVASVEINPHEDGRDAATIYSWDPVWDALTKSTSPEGEVVTFGVDPATGNRTWQEKPMVPGSRVTFWYWATGLPSAVQYPTVAGTTPVDSTYYDARGNAYRLVSPKHYATTLTLDGLGRVTGTRQQIDPANPALTTLDSTTYDIMGRVTTNYTWGPAMSGAPAESLVVTSGYYPNGDLHTLTRTPSSGPVPSLTTTWIYDELGHVTQEIAPDGQIDRTMYDAAGNAYARVTRNGDTLTYTHDALNRLLVSRAPARSYSGRTSTVCAGSCAPEYFGYDESLPQYDLSPGQHLTVAATADTLSYDPISGRIRLAANRDAHVSRTYYRNGSLKSETQNIRAVQSGLDPAQHVYTLNYAYDRDGRVTNLGVPSALQPRTASGSVLGTDIQYTYDVASGLLTQVRDVLGYTSTASYNARGERELLSSPGVSLTQSWNEESQLASQSARSTPGVTLVSTIYGYDARGKMTSMVGSAGPQLSVSSSYSGLGNLVASNSSERSLGGTELLYTPQETFVISPLGDLVYATTTTDQAVTTGGRFLGSGSAQRQTYDKRTAYNSLSGRLDSQESPGRTENFVYDAAGNTIWMTGIPNSSASSEERATYYDAAGKIRAVDYRTAVSGRAETAPSMQLVSTFEEYAYDALGRRVLVRTRKMCGYQFGDDPFCGIGTVRRTVWDGSAELGEIQQPGDNASSAAEMENDGPLTGARPTPKGEDASPFFGVVVYAYGFHGVDQPITVVRSNYQDKPSGEPNPIRVDAFAFTPIWSAVGKVESYTFANGTFGQSFSGYEVKIAFPDGWLAFNRNRFVPRSWQGTLVEGKRDGSGTHYRRNRVYDPLTGRFTQEDPIGLAGGMNLYGYADGDPVNYSDPLGLCPENKPLCQWIKALLIAAGTDIGGVLGGGSGLLTGPGAPVAIPAGAVGGMAAGALGGALLGNAIDHTFFSESEGGGASEPTPQQRADQQFAQRVRLDVNNPAVQNRAMSVRNFIAKFRKASVQREMPGEYMNGSVEDALRSGNSTVRKLLIDGRFAK